MEDKIPQPDPVSKLYAMADNVVVQNRVYRRTLSTHQRANPEYGRLEKSINDLQETTEKCRKAGKGGGQP